jgi:hypothetical protein
MMNKILTITFISLLSTALMFSALGKDITVTGKVVDTTGAGIADAIILLTGDAEALNNPLDSNVNIDTAFSGSDGSFTKTMTVPDNAPLLYYGVAKSAYKLKVWFGVINQMNNTAALGNIELVIETFITVTFTGTVKDSLAGTPLPGALVILTTIHGMLDSVFDSVVTDVQGYFAVEMEIGEGDTGLLAPRGFYMAYANGYESKMGAEVLEQDKIEFGDILLKKLIDPIIYNPTIKSFRKIPNNIIVYTLKGQVIYKGREMNLEKILTNRLARSQPVIVHFKRDKTVLYNRKILAIH